MKLNDYKLIFIAIGLISVLLVATPALADAIRLPGGEPFSELYLLGSGGTADNYPFNIEVGQNYSVYVGVGNHLGSSAYYILYVKFCNETDPLPNANPGAQSYLQPLIEYRFLIADGMNWESLLNFSVSDASILGNNSQINTLQINGATFNVDKPALWDSNSTMFKYRLSFELWMYNSQSNAISYNDRFVDLQLNLTRTLS